jgi:hypothetical protein
LSTPPGPPPDQPDRPDQPKQPGPPSPPASQQSGWGPPTGQQEGWDQGPYLGPPGPAPAPAPRQRNSTVLLVALTVVGLLVGLGVGVAIGRGTKTQPASSASSTTTAATSTAEETTPAPEPTPEETTPPPEEDTFKIGQTAEWEDRVTAVIVSVKRTSFGETATTPGPGVRVTFRITNGSAASLDLSHPTMDVRLGTAGAAAEQVFADNCGGAGDFGRLAPKRTVTGALCFAGRASVVDVSFAPTFDYNALTWTGKVT